MKSPAYYAFLLRIWQSGTPEQPDWRASLEEPHLHEVLGFKTIQELCQYLTQIQTIEGQKDLDSFPGKGDPHEE